MPQQTPRPASQIKMSTSLPEIKHPLSRQLANPSTMDVKGVSRMGHSQSCFDPPLTGRPLPKEENVNVRHSISGARVIKQNKEVSVNPAVMCTIPEGVEVQYGDTTTTKLPVFGCRASISERGNQSRASSLVSLTSGQARLEIDQLEAHLREKLRNNYYQIRKQFKVNDPEERGNVSREAFSRILATVLGMPVSARKCQRLLERMGFSDRQIISFPEFFSCFREVPESTYPQWMDPVHRPKRSVIPMSSLQAHAHLKEKVKHRFLTLADLLPQANPGGSDHITKTEFQQMLNRMNLYMDDSEFEKLWIRYEPDNKGTISAERLLHALGIELKNHSAEISKKRNHSLEVETQLDLTQTADIAQNSARSWKKKELERRQELNVEKWLKNKFRKGFFDMRDAFEKKDPERTGLVTFHDFLDVLGQFGMQLEKNLLVAFLNRCSVKVTGKNVPYREFLSRFQRRGDKGVAHPVLQEIKNSNNQITDNTTEPAISALEDQLKNMFQKDFIALLAMFRKFDHAGTDTIRPEEFRAAIESKFNLRLTDSQFESFFERLPLDDEGNVLYIKFMQEFDGRSQASSLFGSQSDVLDLEKENLSVRSNKSDSPRSDKNSHGSVTPVDSELNKNDQSKRRSCHELFKVIKDLISKKHQELEQRFYDLDETNTRRLTQDRMYMLLKSFDIQPEISRSEIRDLWKTFITNSDKTLDYLQFVRHFGFSMRSATFPNAKLQPPRRGDADFMIRSRKLNCAVDILHDHLRAKVEYLWDDLRREFANMDPYNTGCVSREEFEEVLAELCVNLDNTELKQLSERFKAKNDGRISYIEFLRPFALKKQQWRRDNDVLGVGQDSHANIPDPESEKAKPSGLQELSNKLRKQLSGDWKNLRRAFRKLDIAGHGFLSLPEFRSVLKLANLILNEEEVYQVMAEFDPDLAGKISYEQFIEKTFQPEIRQSIRSK